MHSKKMFTGLAIVFVVVGSQFASTSAFAAEVSVPAPTANARASASSNFQGDLDAYNQALGAFTTANSAYVTLKASNSPLKVLQPAYLAAMKAYVKAGQCYLVAVRGVSLTYAIDVANATKSARTALRSATNAEQKNAVTTAFNSAISAATTARDTSLAQLAPLGDAPQRPAVSAPATAVQPAPIGGNK